MILPGVTIGKNAMIAAGAVVTKDVGDDCTLIPQITLLGGGGINNPFFAFLADSKVIKNPKNPLSYKTSNHRAIFNIYGRVA